MQWKQSPAIESIYPFIPKQWNRVNFQEVVLAIWYFVFKPSRKTGILIKLIQAILLWSVVIRNTLLFRIIMTIFTATMSTLIIFILLDDINYNLED